MVNQIDPLFVPINDGAKIIGLGRSKFYELISQKKIPLVKLGRKSLVSVAALRTFAESLTNSTA